MKRVDIKAGFSCNNRCLFCVQGNKRERYPDKTTGEVKTILKKAKKNCDGVVFTGGEPTIRKDLAELVFFAKKLGYRAIQIQTNGRMFFYLDFCQKMIGAGANEFGIALHGPNAKIHDFLTCGPDSFNQATEGIRNLKKLGQKVITNTVITKINYRYLPEIARLLVNLNVDQFQFAFIHICDEVRKYRKEIIPKQSEVMAYIKKGLQIGIDAGLPVMTEAIPYCFMEGYEDYVVEKKIPDTQVFDVNFVIEDFTKYRQVEGKMKGPRCPQCKYFKICEGPWKEYPEIFGWEEFKPVK